MECFHKDTLKYEGECIKEESCKVSPKINLLCGVNGITYWNLDHLLCNKMSLDYHG